MGFVFVFILLFFVACQRKNVQPISKTNFYFDTVITITLYDSVEMDLIEECFQFCNDFEQTVSRTIENSDIFRINHAKGQPVTVSDTTIALLKKGIEYGELTNGAFDITIAPLATLWDIKNNPGVIPDESEIQEALSHVNYKNISLSGNEVTLLDPDASIDLGGIAKGYMADQIKAFLIEKNVKNAIIDLGGNILTIGNKPDGLPYQIGIQKPFANQGQPITSVAISDSSAVSSGVYERYFEYEGRIYHHILNTDTGFPYENGLYGVTILSKNSVDGDALSTSVFALGLEDGMKLIQSLEGIEALFITDTFEIIDSRT